MQNYLKHKSGVNSFQAKQIFSLRSHSLDVSANYPKKYGRKKICVCGNEDDQFHCFSCVMLHDYPVTSNIANIQYIEIYGENTEKQFLVTKIMMSGFERRKVLLSSLFEGEEPAGSQDADDPGCHT